MAWFYEFGKTFDDLEKHLSPLFPEEFPGGGLIKAGGRSRLNGKEEVVVLGVCWAGQGQLQLWKVLKLKGRKFIYKMASLVASHSKVIFAWYRSDSVAR
jgi:hypothetical protein